MLKTEDKEKVYGLVYAYLKVKIFVVTIEST